MMVVELDPYKKEHYRWVVVRAGSPVLVHVDPQDITVQTLATIMDMPKDWQISPLFYTAQYLLKTGHTVYNDEVWRIFVEPKNIKPGKVHAVYSLYLEEVCQAQYLLLDDFILTTYLQKMLPESVVPEAVALLTMMKPFFYGGARWKVYKDAIEIVDGSPVGPKAAYNLSNTFDKMTQLSEAAKLSVGQLNAIFTDKTAPFPVVTVQQSQVSIWLLREGSSHVAWWVLKPSYETLKWCLEKEYNTSIIGEFMVYVLLQGNPYNIEAGKQLKLEEWPEYETFIKEE